MEKTFFLTDAEYKDGFVVEEYKGKTKLVAARQGKDKIFETWAEFELGKDKVKKRLPVSINLGTDPVARVKELLAFMEPF